MWNPLSLGTKNRSLENVPRRKNTTPEDVLFPLAISSVLCSISAEVQTAIQAMGSTFLKTNICELFFLHDNFLRPENSNST